jgi:hypothetical protein
MLDAAPLELARMELAMTFQALWHECIALGASLSLGDLASFLRGDDTPAPHRMQYDVIVQALNEAFLDRQLAPTLSYSSP